MLAVGPPVKSNHAIVFNQYVVRDEIREFAAGKSDYDQTAFKSYAPGAALADFASDRIINHVRAAPLCLALYKIDKILCLVVDRKMRPIFQYDIKLVVRTGGADYLARFKRAGNLHRRKPDSSGCRMHQDSFSLL